MLECATEESPVPAAIVLDVAVAMQMDKDKSVQLSYVVANHGLFSGCFTSQADNQFAQASH